MNSPLIALKWSAILAEQETTTEPGEDHLRNINSKFSE